VLELLFVGVILLIIIDALLLFWVLLLMIVELFVDGGFGSFQKLIKVSPKL
jgi:hypothetical protein